MAISINLFFLFICLFSLCWNVSNCQAPYEYGISDNLFNPFIQSSLENIQLFKTKVFKLIETQNQYFELIQQARPAFGDYEYVKFDVLLPGLDYSLPLMDNQQMISVPKPNVPSNYTQLLLSISQNSQLHLWQFVSDATIVEVAKYRFRQTTFGEHYQCVKLKSFVLQNEIPKFRLNIIALFRQRNQFHHSSDVLLVLAINLLIKGSDVILQTDFIEEQMIKFERIPDFDLLCVSQSRIFLGLIQNSEDSNFKYELSLYQFVNEKIFDKIAWQISDYILNANQVKLTSLNNGIYLICSYNFLSKHQFDNVKFDYSQSNFINIFQLVENLEYNHGAKLIFVSSVNNLTTTTTKQIHHLSSNNDFFFLVKKDDVDVYWWDGHSLIYYDTIAESRPLSFALEKLPDQPPLILSTDGRTLNLYYKIYSKFIHHQLDLFIDSQYILENIEIFTFNRQYFVWLKFSEDGNFQSNLKYYCQFARVQSRPPEPNENIHNLDTCLMDLRNRLDKGLRQVKTLKKESKELLVISPQSPFIDVDVIVHDTFITQRTVPELISIKVPENVVKGNRIVIFLDTIYSRLDHLENRINNTVMLKFSNQTISSPIEFIHPVRTEELLLNSMETHFHLNDINFDTYANDSLTINTDQTINSRYIFVNGLQIDQLLVNYINGIEMKFVMSTNLTSSTQFVSRALHRYHIIELLNGTNVPQINDVRLVDVYQDRPFPIQLLRGTKTFSNISVSKIAVDAGLNKLNFRNFLSRIVWLENPNITMQRLSGDWEFNEKISVQHLSVINKINGKINFDHFVKNTVKKNASSIIFQSPIYFQNYVNADSNLIVTGLINGFDLYEDVILLHGNQDFSKKYFYSTPLLVFESWASFKNLTIETLNNQFKTQDFFLKSSLKGTPLKGKLRKKIFLNDLVVMGDVNMRPKTRMNQVEISQLFYNLDTLESFSTPVRTKEIIISGHAFTNQFNQFHSFYVQQRFSNLLLRNIPQEFNIPLSYFGRLQASKLSFELFRNQLQFPNDFISKYQSEDILITGEKYFEQPITVNNIYLGSNGSINDRRIAEFHNTMVRLNNFQKTEKIRGMKTFASLKIKGNIYVHNGMINGHLLNQTIDIDSNKEQIIENPMFFSNIISLNPNSEVKVQDLLITRTINGINYKKFWNDIVEKPSERYPILEVFNKHFPNGLQVHNILINGTINGIDLQNAMKNAVTLDSPQNISSSIFFMNATFNQIINFQRINNLDRKYFKQVVRKDSPIVHIQTTSLGLESIQGYWNIKNMNVIGTINGYNITDINNRSLKKNSAVKQIITAKHVFLKPIEILNLELPIETVEINKVPIRNFVWLHSSNVIFNTDVIFENLKQIGNLTVYGLINRCYFNDMISTSIKRGPNSLTYNLTGNYIIKKLVINGNVHFGSIVNQKRNFISNLVQVEDHRSLKPNVYFINDIIVKKIYINNLINHRNLSFLLHDAVYSHRPQKITGVKTFKNPLKVFGHIDQVQGQLLLRNRFNHYNLSNLFATTVKTNEVRPIYGNKIFTGNITFGRSVHLGQGLNGYRFPEDYVLTYTNETIYGKTNFHKKVRIHRNLNVQLINYINVTKFFHDAIMINESVPKQVSATVRFQNPIKVVNLTVHKNINDIDVDDLVTRYSDSIQIPGKKIFNGELIIDGELNVRTNSINNVHLIRDIYNEWIDRRQLHTSINSITGKLVFENSIHADTMKINATLNGVPVNQFNKQLIQIGKDIDHYKRELENSLRKTKRDEQMITKNLTSNFLSDLKYFELQQVLSFGVKNFYPISDDNGQNTKALIGVGVKTHPTMKNCYLYESRNFYIDSDGFAHEYQMPDLWNNGTMIIAQGNNSLAIITSINDSCNEEKQSEQKYLVQFWSTFEFLSILEPSEIHDLIQTNVYFEILHRDHYIKSARIFNSSGTDYLLVYYSFKSEFNAGNLKLFKYLKNKLVEMDKFNSMPIIDFDLYEFVDLILLSVLYDNNFQSINQTIKLYQWNPKQEDFELYTAINTLEQYHFTKIIPMWNRLLILYGQSDSYNCQKLSDDSYHIDLFEVVQSKMSIWMQSYQRIFSKLKTINGVHVLNIGPTTYLLFYSSFKIELYEFHGYNKFEYISEFQVLGKIVSIEHYWINSERIYLVIGTSYGDNWILSAVINGRMEKNFLSHLRKSVINQDEN